MKCLFIIHEKLNAEQIERQYLLMIAMLNYDFQVDVVLTVDAYQQWLKNPILSKRINALNMYGIEQIKVLTDSTSFNDNHMIEVIEPKHLEQFKISAHFIS